MKKKVVQILLILCLILTLVFGGCVRSATSAPPPPTLTPPAPLSSSPSTPNPLGKPTPQTLLDSDGDGFSDWFEINIAGYNPNIPNDRYVVQFSYLSEEKKPDTKGEVDRSAQFILEKGKVPAENIVVLGWEKATYSHFKKAIEEIARKADENDIVLIRLSGHGTSLGISGYDAAYLSPEEVKARTKADPNFCYTDYWNEYYVEHNDYPGINYTDLDKLLNKIKAKAVIVTIMACGCEAALPILKDGSCPRIIFVNTSGEFIRGLGADPDYFYTADTKYGNGDGYVSVGEIANWKENDPFWGEDWGRPYTTFEELFEKGRSFKEAEGYSPMSDTSNIASKIYLTDYYCKNPGLIR